MSATHTCIQTKALRRVLWGVRAPRRGRGTHTNIYPSILQKFAYRVRCVPGGRTGGRGHQENSKQGPQRAAAAIRPTTGRREATIYFGYTTEELGTHHQQTCTRWHPQHATTDNAEVRTNPEETVWVTPLAKKVVLSRVYRRSKTQAHPHHPQLSLRATRKSTCGLLPP